MVKRVSQYNVHDLIIGRWSPRAMSGEAISKKQLMSLFEAARWAPSAYNNQPWRFVYAVRGTKAFDSFFDLLVDFNKQWAKNAAVLVIVVSKNHFEFNGKLSRTHAFDSGAAWQNLALQGYAMNLAVRGMGGFSYQKARELINLPDDYTVQVMIAIGKPGKKEDLPEELQKAEEKSDRKKIEEFVMQNTFIE